MRHASSGDLIADRRFEHARGYAADGDYAAAAELFEQTLERAPGWLPARSALADSLIALGRRDEAVAILEALSADDPADLFGASLRLSALGRLPVPTTPPAAYVRGLFDSYADRFDRALVETLGYRVPWRFGEVLADLRPAQEGRPAFGRVLDLGCGTGLMGEVLRARTTHLEGVDLSPEMVERARGKAVYDRLAVGDAVAELAASDAVYDLVIAADVFMYLGTLEAVFTAAADRLIAGGLFAFSVEKADAGDVVLRESLRYAHGGAYLRRLAEAAGFAPFWIGEEAIRFDRGEPVMGYLLVLERTGVASRAPVSSGLGFAPDLSSGEPV